MEHIQVFLQRGEIMKEHSNSITNFIPLRRGESLTLLNTGQLAASLAMWIWAAPSNLTHNEGLELDKKCPGLSIIQQCETPYRTSIEKILSPQIVQR